MDTSAEQTGFEHYPADSDNLRQTPAVALPAVMSLLLRCVPWAQHVPLSRALNMYAYRCIAGAIDTMRQSNEAAAGCLQQHGASACTDVTGFGLLGHILEMAQASQVSCLAVHSMLHIPAISMNAALVVQSLSPCECK